MRIIFENEEEKEKFFGALAIGSITCPSDIGLNDTDVFARSCHCDCMSCWTNAMAHEVKEPEA